MSSIAIDIVLLVPNEVAHKSRLANERLVQSLPSGFRFDDTHIPHITLLQSYLPRDLVVVPDGVVHQKLKRIVQETLSNRPLLLHVTGISTGPAFAPNTFLPSFAVQRSVPLDALHSAISRALREHYYLPEPSDFKSYFFVDDNERQQSANPINVGTSNWVKYFEEVSFERYFPHVTLGAGTQEAVNALTHDRSLNQPFDFVANRLAVCQLGNFGTCRKILYEIPLAD